MEVRILHATWQQGPQGPRFTTHWQAALETVARDQQDTTWICSAQCFFDRSHPPTPFVRNNSTHCANRLPREKESLKRKSQLPETEMKV